MGSIIEAILDDERIERHELEEKKRERDRLERKNKVLLTLSDWSNLEVESKEFATVEFLIENKDKIFRNRQLIKLLG